MRARSIAIRLLPVLLSLSAAAAQDRVMVGEDIYVAAGEEIDTAVCIGCSIRVDGKVRKEAVAVGGGVEVNGAGEGEVVSIFGRLRIHGEVHQEAVVIGGGMEVSGKIGQDAVAVLSSIRLSPGAEIGGNTIAVLGGVDGKKGATLGGSVHESEALRAWAISGAALLVLLILLFTMLAGPFVTFVVVAILGESRVETVQQTAAQRAGMSFLIGLAVWLASIVMPVTMFWAPGVDMLVTVAFFVVAAIGYAGLGLWVGRGLIRSGGVMGPAIVGSGVIAAIQLIPLLGWFIAWPIFGLLALGAATLSGFGTSIDWMLRRTEIEPTPRPTSV